jgi:hypothetical protein|tara:strand:- start:1906 stop:2193 length:288 start_codon:yes stop_codon:yes gene_type:complete
MMDLGTSSIGDFTVTTTHNRGLNTEELTNLAVNKIISISATADPVLRQQAEAGRERMRMIIRASLDQAIKSDRLTLAHLLESQGHLDMAQILRKI